MDIGRIFARNLKEIRNFKGLSQEELAHRAHIDRTYVSSLERKIYSPTLDTIDGLARALGVTPIDLLKEDLLEDETWKAFIGSSEQKKANKRK